MKDTDHIRFDWAIKQMLRDKANFVILEGLISVLLNNKVKITEVLESESNQQTLEDKFNRVDLMVKSEDGEIFIVEVQLTRDLHFMKRILYGTSKAVTEHIKLGESYKNVKKIYSINVLYFDLGKGEDYLYHGKTTFTGCFKKDELKVKKKEMEALDGDSKARFVDTDIFPEYYLIRVNKFNEVAKTPIEEWMAFLKNGEIRKNTNTPGLKEAEEKLRISNMSEQERKEYFAHVDAIMSQNDTIETYRTEGETIGFAKGKAEGIAEGRAEGDAIGMQKKTFEIAKILKDQGVDLDTIKNAGGLSKEEIGHL
ncbi:MAG: Rpn family recombination-promoting nuclease/putative transposase [Paludibacteraceae bacterium]|nr:Rpn family recombination-promoting nuclease/putative transposase [Paludibacteraceae bacterium]